MESSTPVFDLLSNKNNWTQEFYAENVNGGIVDPCSSNACRWCAIGAITKVANGNETLKSILYERLNDACKRLFDGKSIITVNDRLGYDEILSAIKEAGI